MPGQIIRLHPQAPAKPPAGEPCNGCGVCCAWEPCPIGVLISRRRHGACAALAWDDARGRYLCQAVAAPQVLWPRLPGVLGRLAARLARRWIAAGQGCDCTAEVVAPGAGPRIPG